MLLLRRGCRLTRTRRLTSARLRRLTGARGLRPGLASFSLARRHAQAQAVDELHESAEVEHVGDPCGAETLAGPLGPAKVAGTRSAHTGVVHSVLEELMWSAKELAKELGVLKKIKIFSILNWGLSEGVSEYLCLYFYIKTCKNGKK